MSLVEILEFEEGFSEAPYLCSEGYPTIGIGTKIGNKGVPLEAFCFTVTLDAASALLKAETDKNLVKLNKLNWFNSLNKPRQIIVQSMAYQLGFTGVCKFKKMIQAIENMDFEEVATQALDSRWARQTPERARRHAAVLQTGTFSTIY